MKNLDTFLSLLKGLTSSAEGAAVLESVAQCGGKKDLCQLVGDYLLDPIDSLTLDLVRKIDERSRQLARDTLSLREDHPDFDDNDVPACLWLWARIIEHVLSTDARPFCTFCYRTVALRSNGRLKEYCPEHASNKGNAGGYLRGRAHQKAFEEFLADQESPDDLVLGLLRFELNSRRKAGGNAGYVFKESIRKIQASGIRLDIKLDDLHWMTQGHPDWTELALRWRQHVEDYEGVGQISKGLIAVTPSQLVEQWIRWNAWKERGDFSARVGKGRPTKIDHDEALRLRAEGMRVSDIAKHFPEVNPKSLIVFFSRWDLAHIDREQALQMRNEGKTDAEIAAHFSVSPKSVTKVLALEEGVPD